MISGGAELSYWEEKIIIIIAIIICFIGYHYITEKGEKVNSTTSSKNSVQLI